MESRWGPGRLSNISREPGFSMISLLPSPCLAVKGALKGTVVTTCKRGAQLRPKGRAQPSAAKGLLEHSHAHPSTHRLRLQQRSSGAVNDGLAG